MKKGIKNTGLSFIAVAILTIIAHSVIPHHHHLDSLFSHFNEISKISHNKSGGEDKTAHCHAFNEFAIDKAGQNINFNPDISALQSQVVEIPVPLSFYTNRDFTEINHKSQFVFLFKLLRGPPQNLSLA